jgi:hypothetical protein
VNPVTGEIARVGAGERFESEVEAKAAGFTVPLDDAEDKLLRGMNRRQRRAWLRKRGGFKR